MANAGIDGAGGPDSLDTPDDVWERVLDTNVMAHVRAARALVPGWLEDGGGRFVVTASAAGLLTMIGSAPYSVTKHAAVAFAEWLSVTYGDRGVTVQAICPQGVQTRMLEEAGPAPGPAQSRDAALTPDEVADAWVAVAGRRPLPGAAAPRGGRLLRGPGRGHRPLAGRDAPAPAARSTTRGGLMTELSTTGVRGPGPRRVRRLVRRAAAGRDRRRAPGRLIAGGKSNLTYEVTDGDLVVGGAPPAARPRAGHRARHGPRVHRHHRTGRHRRAGARDVRPLRTTRT